MSVNTMSSRPIPVGSAVVENANVSAVSWAAVFAGALGAVATSVIMIELGLGLGFSSVSAWTNSGVSLATLGVMGGVWLLLTQWISSGIGGYLAGRLRTKWVGVHTDEVFFRDTAHGFLSWSLGTVIGVLIIAMGASSTLSAGARVAGAAAGGAAVAGGAAAASQSASSQPISDPYFVDMLFRPAAGASGAAAGTTTGDASGTPAGSSAAASAAGSAPAGNATGSGVATGNIPSPGAIASQGAAVSPTGAAAMPSGEAAGNGGMANPRGAGEDRALAVRIFARDLPSGNLTPDDRTYLAQMIAARTGMTQAQAEQRVDNTVAQIKSAENQARAAAEKARKAAAFGSIAAALAMLVGAFIACVTAAMGGRLRDEY